MEFDILLKFINELSGYIELEFIFCDIEVFCFFVGEKGIVCIFFGILLLFFVVEVDVFFMLL